MQRGSGGYMERRLDVRGWMRDRDWMVADKMVV